MHEDKRDKVAHKVTVCYSKVELQGDGSFILQTMLQVGHILTKLGQLPFVLITDIA